MKLDTATQQAKQTILERYGIETDFNICDQWKMWGIARLELQSNETYELFVRHESSLRDVYQQIKPIPWKALLIAANTAIDESSITEK